MDQAIHVEMALYGVEVKGLGVWVGGEFVEMAEVRASSSSYNHVVNTPRIGGCTGAFFNLFDWNSKRFASTKRLPAGECLSVWAGRIYCLRILD